MSSSLLALDFDGVICNGLREYFQTSWQVYLRLWGTEEQQLPSDSVRQAFYHLRPVVETGWEMPVLIHALESGFTEENILQDWLNIALELLHHHQIIPPQVGSIVDEVRDRWIAEDLESWLGLHDFYPGMLEFLKSLDYFVIISTKEARFIQALLERYGVAITSDRIHGKEQQRPKYLTLQQLLPHYESITFIEDRFKTLQTIAGHSELDSVKLLLADWGYNLPQEREMARQSGRIDLVTLDEFCQISTQ
jgi:phosphoglycolate phosphatase-like HAD superfamily hydrolase